jgi:hypothetical protein
MEIPVDFTVYDRLTSSRPFDVKVDFKTGAIKTDVETGRTVYSGQLVAFGPRGAEILPISVASDGPPKVQPGQDVIVSGLVAIPWVTKEGAVRVSYRAESVSVLGSAVKVA